MSVIALAPDLSNTTAYIESLFSDGVRTADAVLPKLRDNFFVPFGTEKDTDTIIDALLDNWKAAAGESVARRSAKSDQDIIAVFESYLRENAPILWIPRLQWLRWSGTPQASPPVYTLEAYDRTPLFENGAWNWDNVRRFLKLFVFGAHFVAMHSRTYLPDGIRNAGFQETFASDGRVKALIRTGVPSSHYTGLISRFVLPDDLNFPTLIDSQTAPPSSPLIIALLVGRTISPTTNTDISIKESFFQLEGWPYLPLIDGEARHIADFNAHTATIWNFSTYGVSPYSEKRAASVFLAPDGWTPEPNPLTKMAPYAGADPIQSWLITDLVSVRKEAVLISSVVSQPAALPGEANRSSDDFPNFTFADNATKLIWEVVDTPDPNAVRFKIRQRKPDEADPVRLDDGRNNQARPATDFKSGKSYYVSNPKDTSAPFRVNVYAVVPT